MAELRLAVVTVLEQKGNSGVVAMRSLFKFRPVGPDRLEDRVVLSHGAASAHIAELRSLASHANREAVPVQSRLLRAERVTIGALGDSYTDEYRYYPPDRSHARNWVELLAATRRASFGPLVRSAADVGARGYAYNFARSGATTTDMVQSELPGLLPLVADGHVRYVAIFAGADDFLSMLRNVATGAVPAGSAAGLPAAVEANAEANLSQAVTSVLAANPTVRLAVATIPDVNVLPTVQAFGAAPQYQPIRLATSTAIEEYNAAIREIAAKNDRIALVDLAAETSSLVSAPGPVPFGGTTISVTTPGNRFRDFFLADGIHVGTVGQGMIADAFVSAIDTSFGARVPGFTPAQIVRWARLVQVTTQRGGGPA